MRVSLLSSSVLSQLPGDLCQYVCMPVKCQVRDMQWHTFVDWFFFGHLSTPTKSLNMYVYTSMHRFICHRLRQAYMTDEAHDGWNVALNYWETLLLCSNVQRRISLQSKLSVPNIFHDSDTLTCTTFHYSIIDGSISKAVTCSARACVSLSAHVVQVSTKHSFVVWRCYLLSNIRLHILLGGYYEFSFLHSLRYCGCHWLDNFGGFESLFIYSLPLIQIPPAKWLSEWILYFFYEWQPFCHN